MTTEAETGGTCLWSRSAKDGWRPPQTRKAGSDSPLEPLERARPCWRVNLDLENREKNRLLLFVAPQFVAINWTQQLCYHPCIPSLLDFPSALTGSQAGHSGRRCRSLLGPDRSPHNSTLRTLCSLPTACPVAPRSQRFMRPAPAALCLQARPLQPSPLHPSCAPHTTSTHEQPGCPHQRPHLRARPLHLWPLCPPHAGCSSTGQQDHE